MHAGLALEQDADVAVLHGGVAAAGAAIDDEGARQSCRLGDKAGVCQRLVGGDHGIGGDGIELGGDLAARISFHRAGIDAVDDRGRTVLDQPVLIRVALGQHADAADAILEPGPVGRNALAERRNTA